MISKIKQKIHIKAIIGNIGLFMFIPAAMSFVSIFIGILFKDSPYANKVLKDLMNDHSVNPIVKFPSFKL